MPLCPRMDYAYTTTWQFSFVVQCSLTLQFHFGKNIGNKNSVSSSIITVLIFGIKYIEPIKLAWYSIFDKLKPILLEIPSVFFHLFIRCAHSSIAIIHANIPQQRAGYPPSFYRCSMSKILCLIDFCKKRLIFITQINIARYKMQYIFILHLSQKKLSSVIQKISQKLDVLVLDIHFLYIPPCKHTWMENLTVTSLLLRKFRVTKHVY